MISIASPTASLLISYSSIALEGGGGGAEVKQQTSHFQDFFQKYFLCTSEIQKRKYCSRQKGLENTSSENSAASLHICKPLPANAFAPLVQIARVFFTRANMVRVKKTRTRWVAPMGLAFYLFIFLLLL